MALLLVQPGIEPSGQFDLADGYTLVGGELGVIYSTGTSGGYQVLKVRTALSTDHAPFYFIDEGTKNYGVYFGNTVTRTATGFTSGADSGTRLGPATYIASGKVTLWGKPGLYAVTSDALDPLQSAATWKGLAPGYGLTVTAAGLLTVSGPSSGTSAVTVVTYCQDETLVTTGGNVQRQFKLIVNFNPFGVLH